MIAAIMQPYFFPYIGYFQLMKAVETFVMLDDVQYVERSWMNRNRIVLGGRPVWITMPVKNASRELAINQRCYLLSEGAPTISRKFHAAYSKSPFFDDINATLEDILAFTDANVARFNTNLLTSVGRTLGLKCHVCHASEISNPLHLRGELRILDLCRRLGVTHYINAIGGTSLYRASNFEANGIRLSFLRTGTAAAQFETGPHYLSITHDLMIRGVHRTKQQLDEYELLDG